MPDTNRAERAEERVRVLEEALRVMLDRYVSLVNCGDCGNWDPETEPSVQQARTALARPRGGSHA
jgi:hypothetical protein